MTRFVFLVGVRFIRDIRSQPESAENMQTWGLTFDDDVTVCDGRELEAESISQGGKSFQYDLKGEYKFDITRKKVFSI